MCVFITWHLWICDCWHKAKLPIAPSQVVFACLHVFSAGWESVFPPLHPHTEERRAHTDYRCLDDTTVPRQSKRLLWNELLRQLDICRPSIQSILFLLFFFFPFKPSPFFFFAPFLGNQKKTKNTLFICFLSKTVFHMYWGDNTCYKSVQSIRVFTPSLPRRRRDGTDTVRDTSCACQSGNFFFMRKVQIRSTLPVALVAFLLYGL